MSAGRRHSAETRARIRDGWARRKAEQRVDFIPDMGRPICGKPMPIAREACARVPGHSTECRTKYALDNAYRLATGRERAA